MSTILTDSQKLLMQPKRVAIYARVSTQEQAYDNFSIETRVSDCKKYCWANQNNILTKRTSRGWTPQEVSEKLLDKCYFGEGGYGKLTRRGNKLIPSNNPIPLHYPPIIDKELFERVQNRLSENRQENNGGANRPYMMKQIN